MDKAKLPTCDNTYKIFVLSYVRPKYTMADGTKKKVGLDFAFAGLLVHEHLSVYAIELKCFLPLPATLRSIVTKIT